MTTKDLVAFTLFILYRFGLCALAIVACIYSFWVVTGLLLALAWTSSFHTKG